ncbi:acyltransferase family protein [Demequina activiva]
MRAVAIGLVLVYHAGVTFLPGGFVGVDVFFVISGFLITGMLVAEAEKRGTISLRRFYARRAKRLLPIASVVLVAAAIVTATVLPVSESRTFGVDIAAAALYVVNWTLAGRSVDYAAQDVGASPVLHFWSLSVEEQFYIAWPLLLILVLVLVRKRRSLVRPTMGVALLVIVIPSFVWSVVLTGRQDPSAFFVTTTRLWELGIGALLAIATPLVRRLPAWSGHVLAATGLAAIGYAAVTFRDTMGWPGSAALVPVLGTAAIIAAGNIVPAGAFQRLLSWRPLVWIGGLSYSLYLWHWVVLVAGRDGFGLEGARWGMALVALSFIPAWVGHHLIENPVRFSERLSVGSTTALVTGAACSLVGIVAGLSVATFAAPATTSEVAGGAEQAHLGAVALGSDPSASVLGTPRDSYPVIWPPLADAGMDIPSYDRAECFTAPTESEAKACDFGDVDSDVHLVAVGDSKLAQWYDALDLVGKANGWRLTMYSKGSCPFSDSGRVRDEQTWQVCSDWNDATLDAILASQPDAVITSQGSKVAVLPENEATATETEEDAITGLTRRWQTLADAGIPVIVLADNPRPPSGYDAITCLTDNAQDATACAFPGDAAVDASGIPAQSAAAAAVPGTVTVDLNDYICPAQQCAPVIGEVIIYRSGAHITNSYAVSLVPVAIERFATAAREVGVAVPASSA